MRVNQSVKVINLILLSLCAIALSFGSSIAKPTPQKKAIKLDKSAQAALQKVKIKKPKRSGILFRKAVTAVCACKNKKCAKKALTIAAKSLNRQRKATKHSMVDIMKADLTRLDRCTKTLGLPSIVRTPAATEKEPKPKETPKVKKPTKEEEEKCEETCKKYCREESKTCRESGVAHSIFGPICFYACADINSFEQPKVESTTFD